MGLDIRWPIGLMFTLIGAILVVSGIATNSDVEMYKRSLGMNINLIWGALLFIFGLLMLISAKIASKSEKKDKK